MADTTFTKTETSSTKGDATLRVDPSSMRGDKTNLRGDTPTGRTDRTSLYIKNERTSLYTVSETSVSEDSSYRPCVRWVIPHRLDFMTFMAKDILILAHDHYIVFFNLQYNTEKVYMANNDTVGDGVEVISAHKAYMFAFAEKTRCPRIMVLTYPHFHIVAKLKDDEVIRYKAVCMMENDLVSSFSGFPNYQVAVWSWRSQQRLVAVPTDVPLSSQIYMASRTHLLVCQCWGEALTVWEVALCYKRTFMLKRTKQQVTGWQVTEPRLVGVCWSTEGQLYAIDKSANLYSVQSDGIGMMTHLEWSEEMTGDDMPCVCTFLSGILIYCPDKTVRWLKKSVSGNNWIAVFKWVPHEPVLRLLCSALCDVACAWTASGLLYRVRPAAEDELDVTAMFYKQRFITKMQLIEPACEHVATINDTGVLCIYEMLTGNLVLMKFVKGEEISFVCSPVEPILCIFGCFELNYGIVVFKYQDLQLTMTDRLCLTHQIVSRVVFSNTGREMIAAAMAAGHVFILNLSTAHKLTIVRYSELGRGLADCLLLRVGDHMRAFNLVLFSDKYPIGERIICINAITGKDNKFAGKMQGPYSRLLPLALKDHVLAVPQLARSFHICRLNGDKGVTVTVKMQAIIATGHDMKHFDGFFIDSALLTFGYDGHAILRRPTAPEEYELKVPVSHRYEGGVKSAVVDSGGTCIVSLANNRTLALTMLYKERVQVRHESINLAMLNESEHIIYINEHNAKNYLDLQEEKRVREEAQECRLEREEVLKGFLEAQLQLVELLEENIAERPLHQLSLAEFNLHLEQKKERNKQAEKEREEIRLDTEARIRAQDRVCRWIKAQCWDTMHTQRVKLFAIFSHYHVENYATLPAPLQLATWPRLQETEALRSLEMEHDHNLFRPWEEAALDAVSLFSQQPGGPRLSLLSHDLRPRDVSQLSAVSGAALGAREEEAEEEAHPHVLSGSAAHVFVPVPRYAVPQTLAFSYLQMHWQQEVVKLNAQNMRLWFNKQFDELMSQKRREVGLVADRNARLRFIIEELNKLSDLRGSFHHLLVQIHDPEWRQEEETEKLIKVDPEECSIEPYISPSQIVIPPPEPQPKDDFRERALIEMMDGVLEKLWHEEIKKPIPQPQCMLDKDPEHWNEEDLRVVFEYEAKVRFRNEERDKYRKMLHAEYDKLSQLLNEGVVKFNHRVKETWLLKLRVDSVIGQENLNLMRLRRTNLDRVENSEKMEEYRALIAKVTQEVSSLTAELQEITEQSAAVQASYDQLQVKDKYMERTFKSNFADLSPIIVDQCYKFYRKRPKWQQLRSMTPAVLGTLAGAVLAAVCPATLHHDTLDYFKGVDTLDLVSNMPPVMDEALWASMTRLRRQKIENEIRMRAVAMEMAYVESAVNVWNKAISARNSLLHHTHQDMARLRDHVELTARNKTIQLVLPAGQVEVTTTGHVVDYEDASLVPREDIEKINKVILEVGAMKLRMMRKQMEFRKVILAKEWEHAQMKMKLRHMHEELYSYRRLRIPKELQLYLKNKTLGYTDEMEFIRLEKEREATKMSVNNILTEQIHRVEDLQLKINTIEKKSAELENLMSSLNIQVSEKRIAEDPLEPIRVRRIYKTRMETLVTRSKLIRDVQSNHTTIVLLQTELELLRLRTYPTLASFRTFN